jgi:COX assembly mitochondrial protein 2
MHPPLDRPHPDCQDVIKALKACHQDGWKKYYGGCNRIKFALDECLRLEKKRLLREINVDLTEQKQSEDAMVQYGFGKKESFADYLAKDKDYQKAVEAKLEKQKSQQQQQQQ